MAASDFCFVEWDMILWDHEYEELEDVPLQTWRSASSLIIFTSTQWSDLKEYLLKDSCRVEALSVRAFFPEDDVLWSTLANPACSLTCLRSWGSGSPVGIERAAPLSKFLVTGLRTSRLQHLRLDGSSIRPEGCGLIADAVGSPACRLLGLSLKVRDLKDARHLGTAVVQPGCNLRCLGLDCISTTRSEDFDWVGQLLTDEACCLLDFGLEMYRITGVWLGLEGLECGLQRLKIFSLGDDKIPLPTFSHKLKELIVSGNVFEDVVIALERPDCMLEAVKFSKFVSEVDELLLQRFSQALLNQHSRVKCLEFSGLVPTEGVFTYIAQALRSKDCKLESLRFFRGGGKFSKACGKILVNALELNLRLCTLTTSNLPSDVQQRASNLLKRNRLLKEGGLLQQPQIMPHSARLFLCGHQRVGKTTIRRQLYYDVHRMVKNPLHKPAPEPPTQGMELQALKFGNEQLVLCDLAGHKEYHAFHHFFITGSDRDLFLVVCKMTNLRNQQEFSIKLRYWFRFVASHRTPGNPRPKVIVLLNFFDSPLTGDVMTSIAKHSTKMLMEEYADVLDFGQQGEISNVFGINAMELRHFPPIVHRVRGLLTELLHSRPLIPKICDDISSIISPSMSPFRRTPRELLLPFGHIVEKYAKKFGKQTSLGAPIQAVLVELCIEPQKLVQLYYESVRAALVELHNAGQIVFFPPHDGPDSGDQIVIVDCEWFCCKLIGILMQPEELIDHGRRNLSEPGVWLREDLKNILLQQNCKPEYLDHVLQYLHRLELLYPFQDDEMDPTLPPSKFMVPSLLPERWPVQWFECEDKEAIFGRRLECEDKVKTLLPAGAFARLQVKLHSEFGNKSWKIGCGWISFVENCVATIVRFGGETNRWEDRQWIDVMVRYPEPLEQHESTAENIVNSVKKHIFTICQGIDRGCPAVSLQEYVMSKGLVEALESVSRDVVLLDTIKEEVRKKGIGYNLAWSDNRSTPILDLFFPGELRELVTQDLNVLSEIKQEIHIADCDDIDDSPHDSCETLTETNLSEDNWRLLQCIKRELRPISEGVSHIRKNMGSLLKNLQHEKSNILSSCSYQLVKDLLTGPLPVFPFLTDKAGVLQQIKNLVGKEVKLHFMCEWHAGAHEVKGQKGLSVKISKPEWLLRAGPVLVPALRVFCCAARLAATVLLPGSHVFVPSFELLSAFGLNGETIQHEVIPDILKSFVDEVPDLRELTSHQPPVDKSRLEDFLFDLTKGKNVDMERDFQLYRVELPQKKRIAWVCRDHSEGLRRLTNQNPFEGCLKK